MRKQTMRERCTTKCSPIVTDCNTEKKKARPWVPAVYGGSVFRSQEQNWVRNKPTHIYLDKSRNGKIVEIFPEYPYEIWHENGAVFFPDQLISGRVYASYDYSNYRIQKRTYKNMKITNDVLGSMKHDPVTREVALFGSKENWLLQPTPILKTKKGKATAQTIIPATSYTIDYERGMVSFKKEPTGTVYADYGYFDTKELKAEDYDIQNGTFFLEENITFKDDIYVNYSYYEDFYEYRGYYDEGLNKFLHLDLNPSVGHYSTLPSIVHVDGVERVEYRDVQSSQLLNKTIHYYIVPESRGGHSIRHCFSQEEWQMIQSANPMYLLLATVKVREHMTVDDVVVMDARKRGGGLIESLSDKEIDERVLGKQRYWDIGGWDGKAFYRNGTLIITLPKEVLEEYGGQYSEDEVKEIIDKHIAYGTYYLVEFE
ncbi:MAG: hypothetical protein ACI4TD_07820 [Phocaeicola sp.]